MPVPLAHSQCLYLVSPERTEQAAASYQVRRAYAGLGRQPAAWLAQRVALRPEPVAAVQLAIPKA